MWLIRSFKFLSGLLINNDPDNAVPIKGEKIPGLSRCYWGLLSLIADREWYKRLNNGSSITHCLVLGLRVAMRRYILICLCCLIGLFVISPMIYADTVSSTDHAFESEDDAFEPEDQALETSDLAYSAWIDSDKRMKCLYGYAADKTGDHQAAIRIFEDCIERWNDVYSMIWLAQIYEAGVSVKKDLPKSTALMKRGALLQDEAGYSSLARYHYGIALYEGVGTEKNLASAVVFLQQAGNEGITEACEYLQQRGYLCEGPSEDTKP